MDISPATCPLWQCLSREYARINELCEIEKADAALLAHVNKLAQDLAIRICWRDGEFGSYEGLLGYCYRDAGRTAYIPPPVGLYSYFTCLHEIGHAVLRHDAAENKHKSSIEVETEAWEWALANGIVKPDNQIRQYSQLMIETYIPCECNYCRAVRAGLITSD